MICIAKCDLILIWMRPIYLCDFCNGP